ncbi:MAG TPA: YihY/virulence factor BrkB family protein [Gaiellaceae bacterium]|nr:YihY/virulence factor BrkB family protein [Gaiellaceae bacterium]
MRPRWQSFKAIVRLWVDLFARHNLLTYASAIAFQALVALVALLLLGIGVLGEIGRTDVWTRQVGPRIEPKVLHDVYRGVDATFEKIFHAGSWGLIAFAAALAVWEVSGMVRAVMGALATIYGHDDTRPWWIRFPRSLAVAVVLTAALVGAVLLATAAKGAVAGAWSIPWGILRWLLAVGLVATAFGSLLRFAPIEPRTKTWVTGGTALVTVAWVVQTLLFALYLRHADYRSAAGSLLGFYFVTTFLYVAAIILLVGVELDELLRRDLERKERAGILELALGVIRGA